MLLYIIDTNMGCNVVFIKKNTTNCKFYFLDTLEVARKKHCTVQVRSDNRCREQSRGEGEKEKDSEGSNI